MPCTKPAWMPPCRRLGCVREILLGAKKIVDIIGSAVKLMFFGEIVINSRNVRIQVIGGQGIKSETGSIQQSSRRTVTRVEVVGRITRSRGRKRRNRRRVSSGVRENSGDLRRRELRNGTCGRITKPNNPRSERGQWHGSCNSLTSLFPQSFIAIKEERAIFNDRASNRSAEEVSSSYRCRNGFTIRADCPIIKEIVGVEKIILASIESRRPEIIRSPFGNQGDLRSGGTPLIGVCIGCRDAELFDRFRIQPQYRRIERVRLRIVDVYSIERNVRLIAACPGHISGSRHPGLQG